MRHLALHKYLKKVPAKYLKTIPAKYLKTIQAKYLKTIPAKYLKKIGHLSIIKVLRLYSFDHIVYLCIYS